MNMILILCCLALGLVIGGIGLVRDTRLEVCDHGIGPNDSGWLLILLTAIALPCMLVDPHALRSGTSGIVTWQSLDPERAVIFVLAIIIGEVARDPFYAWFTRHVADGPSTAERPKRQTESFEGFTERRRRAAWKSSSFGKDYASYDDYARANGAKSQQKTHRARQSAHKTQTSPTVRQRHLTALGLRGSPSKAEIKSAYRNLVKRYHPDMLMAKGASKQALDMAQSRMQEINAAYAYLYK